MPDIKIISETAHSGVDVKEKLEEIKKRDKELKPRAAKTLEYLSILTSKPKEAKEIKKKLIELNIPRLRDRHIAKIMDILPQDIDSLKMLFTGESLTLKQEDLTRILEALK